jgi:hypothetical protein
MREAGFILSSAPNTALPAGQWTQETQEADHPDKCVAGMATPVET